MITSESKAVLSLKPPSGSRPLDEESNMTSSHQWKLVESKGRVLGALIEIQAVFGRFRFVPSPVNEIWVPPKP